MRQSFASYHGVLDVKKIPAFARVINGLVTVEVPGSQDDRLRVCLCRSQAMNLIFISGARLLAFRASRLAAAAEGSNVVIIECRQ